MILQHMCKRHGVTILFADVRPEIRALLLGNEIATNDENCFFLTADSALEWCEDQLLEETASHVLITDEQRFASSMSVLLHRLVGEPDDSSRFAGMDQFFKKLDVPADHEFYHIADVPDHFYFVAAGRVALYMKSGDSSSSSASPLFQDQDRSELCESMLPGAMFGEVDFFARQYRYLSVNATEPSVVFEMSRASYGAMEKMEPELWKRLRDVLLQSMALAITNKSNTKRHTEKAKLIFYNDMSLVEVLWFKRISQS